MFSNSKGSALGMGSVSPVTDWSDSAGCYVSASQLHVLRDLSLLLPDVQPLP